MSINSKHREALHFKHPFLDQLNEIRSQEDSLQYNKEDVHRRASMPVCSHNEVRRTNRQCLYSLGGFSLSLFAVPERPGYFLHLTQQLRIILACDNSKILPYLPNLTIEENCPDFLKCI